MARQRKQMIAMLSCWIQVGMFLLELFTSLVSKGKKVSSRDYDGVVRSASIRFYYAALIVLPFLRISDNF